MSTRRTRANPSPGGFRSLPVTTVRKSRKPKTTAQAALQTALDAAALTTATTAAPVASSGESSNTTQQHSNSPPTTTSRSQSPLLAESRSQSPIPAESRSTSPPVQYPNAPSVSPSMSSPHMNGIEQQQEPQPSTRTAPKKRTWANEGPSTLQGVGTDYVDDAGEQRPAKRARTHHVIEVAEVVEEQPATKRTLSKSSTSQPHKRITRPLSRPSLRYSSSEEDVSEQRSRQNPRFESLRQLAFPLSETPAQYQLGHISATEVGEQRPVQAGATPNNTSTTPRNFLTPKSARSQSKAQLSPKAVFEPSMAQLSKYDPKAFAQSSYKSYFRDHERAKPAILPDAYDYPDPPNDPILREKYLEERFGDKLPRPRRNYAFNQDKKKPLKEVIRLGKKSYAHYELLKSIEADEEEDIIEAEGGDGPEYTAQALARYRNPPKFDREKFPFPIPPQSTDPPEIRRKLEGIRPPRSRPSTKTSFKSATLFFPATSSQKQIVLTLSPDEAVSMLSMHQYMQSNPSAKVPNQEQTLMLLENFQHVAEAALAHEGAGTQQLQTGPASATTPARDHHDAQPADIDSSASDNHPSEGEDAESEVEPAIPQTPMTQPQAQESHLRHGLSAVKNLVATPFKFLSSQAQKASTGTTNEHPVDGNSLFTQPRHIKPPKTPTRSHSHRRTAPQSERRHTAQTSSSISRHHPQTDRRQRHAGISPHGDSEKTPFYLKGVYSAEQIAAIHRKQDRAVEIREEKRIAEIELEEERRAEVRRKSRETQEALIEEEDGVVSNQSAQSNTPSQKRKRDNGRHESGYHYPSPTASELSEIEADIEAEIEADIAAEAAEAAAAVDDDTKMPDFVRDSPAQSRNHGPTSPALGIRKVQKRVTFADEQLASEPVLYNPSVFQQPPAVQANINGGRYPLAPLSMSSPRLASQNVFVANRQTTQARSIFDTSTSRNISMVDQTTQAQSKWEMPDSGKNLEGTFSAPDPDDSESDEDDNNAEEDAREGSTRGETILPQSQSTSSAVLQENRWSQTPPPKPRPMNAVLPQIPSFLENHEVERAQEPHTEPTVDSLKAPQSPAPLFMLGNHKVTRVEAPTTSAIGPSLAPSHPTPSFAAPSFQSPAAPGSSFAASSPATDSPSAPSRAAPMTLGNYPVKRATEPTAGIPATPQPPATQSPASRPRLTAAELFAAPSSSAPLSASKLFAADLARAKAEMHKPKQPSLLRNVKIMSPLQQEQELRERQKREQEKREQDESDKENRGVIRAVVNSVTYPWEDSRNGFSKEVADAVEAAFKNWKEVNPPMDREEVRRAAGWNVSEVDREVDKHL